MQIENLPDLVDADPVLVRRGRFIDTTFVMPSWTFALRAPAEAWATFFQPVPPPGFNDLFAMLKRRVLKIEGDLHVFMANLLYFKGILATLRTGEGSR